MSLAQKDQLLEIGSRVRLGKPIICKGLSVPGDKSQTFRLMKFEQIFSLRCQTEQAASQEAHHKTFIRMTCQPIFISTQHPSFFSEEVMVEPDGIEPTTSCLQSRRSPS